MNTDKLVPAAQSDADTVHGAERVDMMTIESTVSATVVKSEIERALQRAARNDANEISVDVRGNDVTLSGVVYSLSERELVRTTAWAMPGVRNVVDNMTVAF
jgi:osmotically-inducible protein OsmY